MDYTYRHKKMAGLCSGAERVLDIGWYHAPNPYLRNKVVVGLDLKSRETPPNYTSCLAGDAMNLPEPFGPESFEAIVAGELIEHLENPVDFLRRCARLLTPGGRLVLSTPNPHYPAESLLTITLNRRYFYHPDHVFLFPQRWMIRMMEVAGFTEVKLSSGGVYLPGIGYIPFPRPWCYEYIATGVVKK